MKSDILIQVKRLVVRGVVFIIVFIVLDLVIGGVIQVFYFSQENKYTYGILKTEADIIIVGSSRANSHYIPSILSDTLGMGCYNAGDGGQNIYYYYGIIGSILERYKPKIIIMDVMESDIEYRDNDMDRLSEFLPFYRMSKSIREIIDLRGINERFKLLSKIYPFNSKVPSIVFSYIKKDKNPNLILDGYIPLYGIVSSPITTINSDENVILDTIKTSMIERIVTLCEKNDVQLLIIVSPRFTEIKGMNTSIESLVNFISKNNIGVWDYGQDPYFLTHGELFRDELHLNHKGAVEYSKIIASRIKQDYLGRN